MDFEFPQADQCNILLDAECNILLDEFSKDLNLLPLNYQLPHDNSWDGTKCVPNDMEMKTNPIAHASHADSIIDELLNSLDDPRAWQHQQMHQNHHLERQREQDRQLRLDQKQQQQHQQEPVYYSMENFQDTVPDRLASGELRHLTPRKKTSPGDKRCISLISEPHMLPYRSGRWTEEEIQYASALIEEFEEAVLPLTDGTMLRMFVSTILNCDPMRVSKKFAGRGPAKSMTSSMGTHIFKRDEMAALNLTQEEICAKRKKLVLLEQTLFRKVHDTENVGRDLLLGPAPTPLSMGWHTYDPRSNPIISYFGQNRSALGGRKARIMQVAPTQPGSRSLVKQCSIAIIMEQLQESVNKSKVVRYVQEI